MDQQGLRACIQKEIFIDSEQLDAIMEHFHPRLLSRNSFFLQAGQQCRELAFIEAGYLRMFDKVEGREITFWIGSSGSFITSLSSFVFESNNYWNIQAVTDCQLWVIKREDHFQLLEQNPKWMEFDNKLLARAYAILEKSMFDHLHTTARERLEALLTNDSAIFNNVPHQFIASMLGITPETLSRLRKARAG